MDQSRNHPIPSFQRPLKRGDVNDFNDAQHRRSPKQKIYEWSNSRFEIYLYFINAKRNVGPHPTLISSPRI